MSRAWWRRLEDTWISLLEDISMVEDMKKTFLWTFLWKTFPWVHPLHSDHVGTFWQGLCVHFVRVIAGNSREITRACEFVPFNALSILQLLFN